MILVRDVFRLQFGKAREAVAAWKGIEQHAKNVGWGAESVRVMTDLVGPYYTLVMETTFKDLTSYEQDMKKGMSDPEWRARYQQFTPLVESGYREIYTLIEG